MKIKFFVTMFFALAVIVPQKAFSQVGVKDSFATAQVKSNTKNAQRQTDAVDDIKKTFERTTALIGVGSPSNFSNASKSIKENLEKKIKNIGQNPLSSGPYSKWKLGDDAYEYTNRGSRGIENAIGSFVKNEGASSSNLKQDMDKMKLHQKMGQQFLATTLSNALGNAVATKAETETREKVLEDIESTISGSQSVRDDMIGNTLLLLASAHYYQQLLNVYANSVEVSVASNINKMVKEK